jgi:hypothetical protein
MEQGRLIRIAFLLTLFTAIGTFHRPSNEPVLRSWLDDLSARPMLKSLAGQVDFRGCDGDWNPVSDFWTADVSSLYARTSADSNDPAIKLIEISIAASEDP